MAKVSVSFLLPEDQAALVVECLCYEGGYQATIKDADGNDVKNTVTPGEFARQQVVAILTEKTIAYLDKKAINAIAAQKQALRDAVSSGAVETSSEEIP